MIFSNQLALSSVLSQLVTLDLSVFILVSDLHLPAKAKKEETKIFR